MYIYYTAISAVITVLAMLCAHRTSKQRYYFLIDTGTTFLILMIATMFNMTNSGIYFVAIFNCMAVMIDIIFCNVLENEKYKQTETFIFGLMRHHGCLGVITGIIAIGSNLL